MADRAEWRLRGGFIASVYLLAAPLLLLALAPRLWTRRRAVVGLGEKLGHRAAALPRDRVIVHGVSLGEVMLMRPLVPRLEAALGPCLLTTTTETGRAALDQHFAGHPRCFWPLDVPWAVERFLTRTRPRLVVLLELELWPYLLCACARRGIPVALVNARVSQRSFTRWRAARALARPLFASLALALGQNAVWTARLRALGAREARVCGSMKADMVRPADDAAARAEAQRLGLRQGQPVLLLASTSAGVAVEEMVVLRDGIAPWRARGWRVVICPRHPERGGELVELVRRLGATPRRSSIGERCAGDDDVAIVDEIGRLAALYGWTAGVAGIAVVGGSLGSGRGGQNMLEAAAAGCCVVVGGDTRNFPDAMALLRDADGVVESDNGGIGAVLAALAADDARRLDLGTRARRAWSAGRGATARVVGLLARRFADTPP